jgi:hypothetical protein
LLVEPLRLRGRLAAHVDTRTFWRDASLRFEHGREDVASYADWLDAAALRREVLDPVAETGRYLPSLRDPNSNRSTREQPRELPRSGVLLVSGSLLLGRGLRFDLTVHLAMTAAARARRTAAADHWTLPAYDHYDATVGPQRVADVVIRWDDPLRPAIGGLS